MLTRLDDFPRHQIVETLAHVGTSDLTFSDGYYFCFWDPSGQVSLAMGLRLYPNVDVIDGYVALIRDDRIQSVRMSRRLSLDPDILSVGALTLDITEGLRSRRLRFAAHDERGGLEFDLNWEASHSPYAEERRSERLHGRVVRDLIRYWQAGRPNGKLVVDGRSIPVDSSWYCIMDHSWGTRQSVGPNLDPNDLPPVPTLPPGRDGLLRLVVFAQMPSYIVYFQTHEDASARAHMVEGRIDHADGRLEKVVQIQHELSFRVGTRKVLNAICTVTGADGTVLRLSLSPTHTPTITSALGYALEKRGFTDDRGMGVYRGDEWIESDMWLHDGDEAVDPDGNRFPYNGYIGPAAVNDGIETGMAYFETVVIGSYARYGFQADGPVPVTVLPIS
jgi:hypothetical protein